MNTDLENVVMPVNVQQLEFLLRESQYPEDETRFLVGGFTNGFDIGYEGPQIRQIRSENIPFYSREQGSTVE